jgi:hypothetical protein
MERFRPGPLRLAAPLINKTRNGNRSACEHDPDDGQRRISMTLPSGRNARLDFLPGRIQPHNRLTGATGVDSALIPRRRRRSVAWRVAALKRLSRRPKRVLSRIGTLLSLEA